jgi:hypothetical protein
VEEFQSDRHQAGRKKGYRGEGTTLPQGWTVDEVPTYAYRGGPQTGTEWMVFDASKTQVGFGSKTREEAILSANSGDLQGSVADAPFRTTWPLQLFKRALRDAVDGGKDWIGFTTAQPHIDRWGTERIEWAKQSDGTFLINAKSQHGGNAAGIDLEGEADARNLNPQNSKTVTTEAQFVEAIRPSLTEGQNPEALGAKLWKKMATEDSGVSMPRKEGFEGFYDNMLPKEVGKYVKQFGGKVEKADMTQSVEPDIMSGEEAETGSIPIWKVNITPEMRKISQTGQMRFMPEGVSPEDLNPVANKQEAQGLWADGKQMFAINEMDEKLIPITSKAMLESYPADAIGWMEPQAQNRFMPEKIGYKEITNEIKNFPISKNKEPIPNVSSIKSSLDEFEEMGTRDVPIDFIIDTQNKKYPTYFSGGKEKTLELAESIKKNGIQSPMILVWENDKYPYVLEGSSRYDALRVLNAKGEKLPETVPALTIVDTSKDLRFMPEKLDSDYMKAVESGDVETQQRMVDEAARIAGYEKRWNFSENIGIDENRGAFYTTSSKAAADSWGEGRSGKTRPVFISARARAIEGKNILSSSFMAPDMASKLKSAGFDSASGGKDWKRGDEIAVFSPNQIKSADPITYDNAGNVIPLSKRFDVGSRDMRFMPEGEAKIIDSNIPDKEGGKMRPSTWDSLSKVGYSPEASEKTQIATTAPTYESIVKANATQGMEVLDFSAGRGIGTKAMKAIGKRVGFNVEGYEPFSNEKTRVVAPEYEGEDAINQIPDNSKDIIINNAVLNVVPEDTGRQIVNQIYSKLKPGGSAFINVMGWNNIKNRLDNPKTQLVGPREVVTQKGTFQKGYTAQSLRSLIEQELPDAKIVRTSHGDIGFKVTKPAPPAETMPVINQPAKTGQMRFLPEPVEKLSAFKGKRVQVLTSDLSLVGDVKYGDYTASFKGGPGYLDNDGWAFTDKAAADAFVTRWKKDGEPLIGLASLGSANHLNSLDARKAYAEKWKYLVSTGEISEELANDHIKQAMKRIINSDSKNVKTDWRNAAKMIESADDLSNYFNKIPWAAAPMFYSKLTAKTLPIKYKKLVELGLDLETAAKEYRQPEFEGAELGDLYAIAEYDGSTPEHKPELNKAYPWRIKFKKKATLSEMHNVAKLTTDPRAFAKKKVGGRLGAQPLMVTGINLDKLLTGDITGSAKPLILREGTQKTKSNRAKQFGSGNPEAYRSYQQIQAERNTKKPKKKSTAKGDASAIANAAKLK